MLKNLSASLLLIIFFGCSPTSKETKESLPENLVDRIDLVDLEGNKVDIKEFKDKTIFLNFWATWCKPCIAEMPDIDKASQILGEEDFVFLAASDESIEKIVNYAKDVDFSFKIVKSNRSSFDMDFMALPTTLIINKNGEIVYNEVGARKWDSETEIQRLRDLANK